MVVSAVFSGRIFFFFFGLIRLKTLNIHNKKEQVTSFLHAATTTVDIYEQIAIF